MRIASAQFSAGTDIDENLAGCLSLMGEAASRGAEFLLLPESSLYASVRPDTDLASIAQPLEGPFVSTIRARAAELRLPTAVGITEHNPAGNPFNTVVVVGADGSIMASYRKIHLYDAFGYLESDGITAGAYVEPFVLRYGDLSIGAFTCYDLRFPESARRVVDAGANVLLVPAMWMAGPGKEDQFATLVRARAIENTSFVITANQTGPLATGHSIAVDPAGVVIASAGEAPGLLIADVDPGRIQAVRERVPSLANRRFAVVPRPLLAQALPHSEIGR